MRVSGSYRGWISTLLVAAGMGLLAGCQGVAPSGGSNSNANLAASSSKLSFGSVEKSKSASLTETLTNSGGSAVTISAANVSGSGFSLSGLSLPMSLTPNESVTFTVSFAPASAGAASGTLAIVSTAVNSPLNVALAGTEIAQGQLSISPASLSFGNVVVGANNSLNATVAASGSSVTISGAGSNSNEFTLSGISLPITLNDGQSASFTVTFQPSQTGTASGTLSFASDAANSPTTQALTGDGKAQAQHSAALSWNASTGPDVAGYNVYRGTVSGGPYSQINSSLQSGTSYTDDTVAAGETFYYVTTAVDSSGLESDYSNQAEAVIPAS